MKCTMRNAKCELQAAVGVLPASELLNVGRARSLRAKCGMQSAPVRRCTPSSIMNHPSSFSAAFSLVEVLAAIAIIGIVTFLAIPNIVRIKQDSEDNLARARAETLNMAIASYVQAYGTNEAQRRWTNASTANARYLLITPYIAFAETNLTSFQPSGYSLTLPTSIIPMSASTKTIISNTTLNTGIYY